MTVQDELGQLRRQMQVLHLPNGGKAQTTALKEIVRQLELRLAAQLQEKIALENRISSLTPWGMALLTLVLIPLFASQPNPELRWSRAVLILTLIVALSFVVSHSLDSIRLTRPWFYAGSDMRSDMRLTHANEDDILRVTITHYAEGLQSNRTTLKSLQRFYAAPFFTILVGGLLAFALVGV